MGGGDRVVILTIPVDGVKFSGGTPRLECPRGRVIFASRTGDGWPGPCRRTTKSQKMTQLELEIGASLKPIGWIQVII